MAPIVPAANSTSFNRVTVEAKAASLDYYIFVRNAYTQRRDALVKDEDTAADGSPNDETLYEYIEP